MKIENQVISLELSKELKENGYPQEGHWWWVEKIYDDNSNHWPGHKKPPTEYHLQVGRKTGYYINDIYQGKEKQCYAPTVAELLNVLTKIKKCDIIIPVESANVADYLAQEILNYEKGKERD